MVGRLSNDDLQTHQSRTHPLIPHRHMRPFDPLAVAKWLRNM